MLIRLLKDDDGQDLIEGGILLMLVAIALLLLIPGLEAKLAGAFKDWGDDVYDLWEPDDPL